MRSRGCGARIPRPRVSRIVVADGGSRDAAAARAIAAGAEVIGAGRNGRACLAATIAAEDADIIAFMDLPTSPLP